MENKKLILSLIRDSLLNYKLIDGLDKLGLNADDYCLDIPRAIFSLIGFKKSEQDQDSLYDFYFDLMRRSRKIKIRENPEQLKDLCQDIFIELKAKKIVMREVEKSPCA